MSRSRKTTTTLTTKASTARNSSSSAKNRHPSSRVCKSPTPKTSPRAYLRTQQQGCSMKKECRRGQSASPPGTKSPPGKITANPQSSSSHNEALTIALSDVVLRPLRYGQLSRNNVHTGGIAAHAACYSTTSGSGDQKHRILSAAAGLTLKWRGHEV